MRERQAVFENGEIRGDGRRRPLAGLAGPEGFAAEGGIAFAELQGKYAQASSGAHFCEVGVDSHTGETRVRRMPAS
jgi:xanthine dehydrogenase YagR molybdenum-binding subunit